MQGLPCQQKDLVADSLLYGEPVKLMEHRCDMVILSHHHYFSSSAILYNLQLGKQALGKASK